MKEMEASALVERFLRLMENRDLEAAEALMAPGARIIFPGGKRFASQREMVEAASGRYQRVEKHFACIDAMQQDGDTIVYVLGTLHGINNYGVAFDGIRFVDRFVLRDGLIVSQEVWNDLAESGVLERRGDA